MAHQNKGSCPFTDCSIIMKSLITTLATLVFSASSLAAQPILSPAELDSTLSQNTIRIIDIRDPKSYSEGHVKGSVSAPYGKWRGPADNPGELPDLKELTQLVQSLGLTADTHAVIVSSGANDTDFGAAARVYWTLRVLGLNDLSILNGGIKAWKADGLALDNKAGTVARSDFEPTINQNLLTSRQEIASGNGSARQTLLVDARPAEFFRGDTRHAAARVAGTLEGAVSVPHSLWFKPGSSEVVAASQAASIARQHNLVQPEQEVVSFCNTGHWAATNWFVLSELVGDKDVKLYAGSMVDWTQAQETLPVKNAPGRIKQLWIDAQLWFASL